MQAILASVFDKGKDGGTAKGIDVPGFRCGGKTGTAHKYDPATKKYADDRYLSSFAGLAPIDAPRIAVVVMIDDPEGGDYYGGAVAGPVFAVVASQVLRYLGVPGTAPVAPAAPIVAAPRVVAPAPPASSFVGLGLAQALDRAHQLHLDVAIRGFETGRLAQLSPGQVRLVLE